MMQGQFFKLTLYVPVEQVGIVIGRQGSTINRIQASSSTKLNVVPDPDASAWAPVYIKGSAEGAFNAARQVADLVEELDNAVAEFSLTSKTRNVLRGGGGDDDPSRLSNEAKRASAETNVRIRVPPPLSKGADAEPCTLEGSLLDVQRALALLQQAATNNNRNSNSNNNNNNNNSKAETTKPPQPQPQPAAPRRPVERIVEVPSKKLRLLARRGQQQPVYRMIARYSGVAITKCPKTAPPPAAAVAASSSSCGGGSSSSSPVTTPQHQQREAVPRPPTASPAAPAAPAAPVAPASPIMVAAEDEAPVPDEDSSVSAAAGEDEEDDSADDDGDDDEDEEDDGEDVSGSLNGSSSGAEEEEEEAPRAGKEAALASPKAAEEAAEAASFSVRGAESNVAAACEALRRVIDGEAVKEVTAWLKKNFPTAASRRARSGASSSSGAQPAQQQQSQSQSQQQGTSGGRRPRRRGGAGKSGSLASQQPQAQQQPSASAGTPPAAAAAGRRKTRGGRRRNANKGGEGQS